MAKIFVLNGPNLNLLGTREPEIYGSITLDDINRKIDAIQEANHRYDYIIFNAAAFTHYSIAIRDAVAAIDVPVIEVHLSNIHQRETFRHTSVLASVAMAQISGLGAESYMAALEAVIYKLGSK